MTPSYQKGFTIIETMLFLGITGLLVMGILVGTGAAINIQRYRDSVSSLKSVLQQQYTNVSNVSNSRTSSWVCDNNGQVIESDSGGIPRGQSDCVILGKFITTIDNQNLVVRDVVGSTSEKTVPSNDLEALQKYNLRVSSVDFSGENYRLDWGSTLAVPESGANATFSILILKSPASGAVRTFIDPSSVVADNSVGNLVSATALGSSLRVCVDSQGMFGGGQAAIFIVPGATGPSGVETLGEATSGC